MLLSTLDPLLPLVRSTIAHLASLIPATQFYRYNDSFSRTLQSASLIVVFRKFLETEELAGKEEVASTLGSEYTVRIFVRKWGRWQTNRFGVAVSPEWKDHFFLSTEEYLHATISLLEELVSRNSIPSENFAHLRQTLVEIVDESSNPR